MQASEEDMAVLDQITSFDPDTGAGVVREATGRELRFHLRGTIPGSALSLLEREDVARLQAAAADDMSHLCATVLQSDPTVESTLMSLTMDGDGTFTMVTAPASDVHDYTVVRARCCPRVLGAVAALFNLDE